MSAVDEETDSEIPSYDVEEYEQEAIAELKVLADHLMDEGMKYDHIGHVAHEYGLKLLLIAERGRAINECENIVGDNIDVPLFPQSIDDITETDIGGDADTETDSEE